MSARLSICLKLSLARLAKNLAKSGGILSRKRKVVVFREFCTKSGGFMLLTRSWLIVWIDFAYTHFFISKMEDSYSLSIDDLYGLLL
jgi:hypothetical protein